LPVQNVAMTWPFDARKGELFCPFCGKRFWSIRTRPPAGEHRRFVYLDDVCDYHWLPRDLRAKRGELEENLPENGRVGGKLARLVGLKKTDSAVAFWITTGGMGCGPVWNTCVILLARREVANVPDREGP